jgi:hypothetical protein
MSTTAPRPPAARPAPRPEPTAWDTIKTILKPISSLKLTVGLLALSLGLVFFGTVAQVDFGIWTVVNKYFYSWVAWVPFQLFVRFGQKFLDVDPNLTVSGGFPYPGGWVIGTLLMVNLIAARLMILLLGEFLSSQFKVEGRMSIDEGKSSSLVIDPTRIELAFVDSSDPMNDKVVVIPKKMLKKGGLISHPDLPVNVEVIQFMNNSDVGPAPRTNNPATAGMGLRVMARPSDEVSGVDPNQQYDMPSAYVRLIDKATTQELGTFLLSTRDVPTELRFNPKQPEEINEILELAGRPYEISLRFNHRHLPFSLHLIEFRFDRFVGTQTARNYSSDVRLIDPAEGQNRELRISMNEPLRYRGETFYQSSFDDRTEKTTVLQVVRNRAWTMPYLACALVALGLLFHFGLHLNGFLKRRKRP